MRPCLAAAALAAFMAVPAFARTLCTIVADAADGKVLVEQGDCRSRVTPASTFKIPLAVIGFDTGFLTAEHSPVLDTRPGDPDWGGEAWRQPADPVRWLKYSVVWYSQRIAHALGEPTLHRYARDFGFGNADFAGDPGQDNGLDRAWIMSSLKVSPLEQVVFLRKLVNRQLPAGAVAMDLTLKIVETFHAPTVRRCRARPGPPFRAVPTAASTKRGRTAGSWAGRSAVAGGWCLRG